MARRTSLRNERHPARIASRSLKCNARGMSTPFPEAMTREEPSAAISGPASDCTRCLASASCLVLSCGTCGLYFAFSGAPIGDWLLWNGMFDFSTPIHARLADRVLEVKTRKCGACGWNVKHFAQEQMERFVVIKEDAHWGSATVRNTAAHGGGTDQTYVLVYSEPTPLDTEDEINRVREALPRGCSNDTSCERACTSFCHNLCSNEGMAERAFFPCVSLALQLRSGTRAGTRFVRMSRRVWLARDLDKLLIYAANFNAALPAPVVEGTRVPAERVGRGGRVPVVTGAQAS